MSCKARPPGPSILHHQRASYARARNLDRQSNLLKRPPCTGVARVRLPGRGLSSMMNKYGTRLGRLKYRTAEEARGAARDLGISGVHSHMMDGQKVYMPGSDHESLNRALEQQGLPPTQMPGDKGSSGMSGLLGGGSMDTPPGSEGMPAADMEDIEQPEPIFDIEDLTGDRDDDDSMEIY
jgi:hypothetical protein